MSEHILNGKKLTARPDRIDFRDRIYAPRLISLPDCFPEAGEIQSFLKLYWKHGRIRDQGTEGACTGFGLAAVLNYIIWDRWMRSHNGSPPEGESPPPLASPRMFYDAARVYDEWEGEDYSGSSCRGAMKGWHKHGVCREGAWPRDIGFDRDSPDRWYTDALARPLGAYYRVEAASISDMQAAIHEVRAVYCSARVHEGWDDPSGDETVDVAGFALPVIKHRSEVIGGHAFALVGYTPDGFIVQNSWGESWGYKGFALLTYQDWAENGNDAWVAAMAAPVSVATVQAAPVGISKRPLVETALALRRIENRATSSAVRPWTPDQAHHHSIIMGNDGKLLRRLIDTPTIDAMLDRVLIEGPNQSISEGMEHLVIFAHGGLNSERAALNRAMRLGPWFKANGIHPVFLNWRTSVLESLGGIGEDMTKEFLERRERMAEGVLGDLIDRAKEKLQDQFDKAFEALAEKLIGKPVWSQMKQNAGAAADGSGGTRRVLLHLRNLRESHPNLKVHMVGHSAGSILLGHMLDDFTDDDGLESVTLYAPACTMEFAIRYFGKALSSGIIAPGQLHIDNLNDALERDDRVGPYGKSLLYLVSRALDDVRKAPLLGLERSWLWNDNGSLMNAEDASLSDLKKKHGIYFEETHVKFMRDWNKMVQAHNVSFAFQSEPEMVTKITNGVKLREKRDHGSFDNDIDTVSASLKRILGSNALVAPVDDLTGF